MRASERYGEEKCAAQHVLFSCRCCTGQTEQDETRVPVLIIREKTSD